MPDEKRGRRGWRWSAEAINVLMEPGVRCQEGLYHKGAERVNLTGERTPGPLPRGKGPGGKSERSELVGEIEARHPHLQAVDAGHRIVSGQGNVDRGALAVLDGGVDGEGSRIIAEAGREPVVLELGEQDVLGRDRARIRVIGIAGPDGERVGDEILGPETCLLYTSDAA